MKIPGRVVDERLLAHRLRSTSFGGITAALVAVGLFEYRLFTQHVWNWDLLAVALTMVVVKLAAMVSYRFMD